MGQKKGTDLKIFPLFFYFLRPAAAAIGTKDFGAEIPLSPVGQDGHDDRPGEIPGDFPGPGDSRTAGQTGENSGGRVSDLFLLDELARGRGENGSRFITQGGFALDQAAARGKDPPF